MSTKEIGLKALELALAVFPPLADLIAKAVDGAEDDDLLADEVARMLPEDGASARAKRLLAKG